jgi:predicted ATPase/class 3 adenylate cyclase
VVVLGGSHAAKKIARERQHAGEVVSAIVELPTGTVTFVFTDIEGSTRLLQELGRERYGLLQEQHAEIVRAAIAIGSGVEIRTEGDSFFAAFPTPGGAVLAAVSAQRGLADHAWADGAEIRIRIGMHTGEGSPGGDDYLGIDVNRAARIAAVGNGGQVVLSSATAALVENDLPDGVALRDLGVHRMKDLPQPLQLHDLLIEGLPTEFPSLRSMDARPTNIPPERTSFVGRATEIAELESLLSTTRVVTLTGPGGIGKTRLAVHIAGRALGRFADGVFLVDLSSLIDHEVVIPEIAATLKIRRVPGQNVSDSLQQYLQDRRLLLVLDNVEQVIDAVPAVGSLLDASPGLVLLATSRVPLRLTGEHRYVLDPMPVPSPDERADHAGSFDAVQLFAQRAASVQPGFVLDEASIPAVGRIVAALEGLPLALELAASRMGLLTPEALADRLTQRLPMLTGGPRDAPERQRTLSGTIGWSHDLLAPEAKRLFARLSVFSGGWALDAAERVCGEGLDVLEVLAALVDASLVRRSDPDARETRFSMLETIREFAGAQLEASGEREALATRHAEWARSLAVDAEPHLVDEEQTTWFGVLELEHDNVRAALDLAEERGDDRQAVESGLRTAAAIWRFWQERNHLAEARLRLERLLSLPEARHPDEARARALGAYGGIVYWQSDYVAMRDAYEEAETIARSLGDRSLLGSALFDLSFVPTMAEGDFAAGERILHEALEVAGDDDPLLRSRILGALGFAGMFQGKPLAGIGWFEQAIEIQRTIGDRLGVPQNLVGIAAMQLLLGALDEARANLREATAAATESSAPPMLATVVVPNAVLATVDGRHEDAARLVGAWERLERDHRIGFPDAALAGFGDPANAAREALGDEGFERAYERGFSLDLDGIRRLVLAEGSLADEASGSSV